MMAFVTAARITGSQNNASMAEANDLAAQSLERLRNHVAIDDPLLATEAGNGVWVNDDVPAAGGTQSIIAQGARRCRLVQPGCGGNCWQVSVQVCWNNVAGCNCVQGPLCPTCLP